MTGACAWNLNEFCFISRDVFWLPEVPRHFFAHRHLPRRHRRQGSQHPPHSYRQMPGVRYNYGSLRGALAPRAGVRKKASRSLRGGSLTGVVAL